MRRYGLQRIWWMLEICGGTSPILVWRLMCMGFAHRYALFAETWWLRWMVTIHVVYCWAFAMTLQGRDGCNDSLCVMAD